MKRYLLFSFEQYYPCGGFNDFVASFDTINEAIEAIEKSDDLIRFYEDIQIFDRIEGILISYECQ